MPFFSIIIPIYNLECYIERTILNILNQNFLDYELILVNDGSTDETFNIINNIAKKNDKIKTINKENGGVSSARNLGLKKANGKYIYFLDGDDKIENDLLSNAYSKLKNNDIDIYSFGFDIVEANGKLKKKFSFYEYDNEIFSSQEFQKLYLRKKIRQHICSFCVKRNLILNNSITFNESATHGEDQEFQLKIISVAENIYYKAKAFYHYLDREDSATNQNFSSKKFSAIEAIERAKNFVISKDNNNNLEKYYDNYLIFMFFYLFKQSIFNNFANYYELFEEKEYLLKKFTIDFNYYSFVIIIFYCFYFISKYYMKLRNFFEDM